MLKKEMICIHALGIFDHWWRIQVMYVFVRGDAILYNSVDKQLDLLVGEIQCYKVSVAGVQETK